jgi:predicted mannosyl-3-phosphoglycerate phosphatase (HAD superfamily)
MRSLYVDVDDTLLRGGRIVDPVMAAIDAAMGRGTDVVIWSARGKAHAERAAQMAGLEGRVACLCKPDGIIDDRGWSWVRHARVLSGRDLGLIVDAIENIAEKSTG